MIIIFCTAHLALRADLFDLINGWVANGPYACGKQQLTALLDQ
jgi:hypothetical protein